MLVLRVLSFRSIHNVQVGALLQGTFENLRDILHLRDTSKVIYERIVGMKSESYENIVLFFRKKIIQ